MAGSFAYQKQLVDGKFQPLGVYTVTVDADYIAPADASLILWNVPGQTVSRTINFNQIPIGSEVQVNVIDSNGEFVQDDYTGGTLFSLIGGTSHITANVRSVDGPLGQIVLSDGTAAQYNIGTSGLTLGLLNTANTISGIWTHTANLLLNGGTGKLNVNSGSNVADDLITLYPGLALLGVQPGVFKYTVGAAVRHGFFTSTGESLDIDSTGTRIGVNSTGGRINAILVGTATWDPGSTATGTVASTTLTVTGAVVGDVAIPSWEDTTAGWVTTAFVSAANTVTVNALFMGAVSDDPGSFTLRAWVIKR